MKVMRTPDERFADLPGYPFEPHYTEVNGLRMHYVDEGSGDPILCLHGEPSWSYLYRKMIPPLAKSNRVIAPDVIGFGRSDKPASNDDYTYALHHGAVTAFVKNLDLKRITLVCQDWGGLIGLPIATEMPERFSRVVIMNTGLPTGEETPTPGFIAWRTAASKMTDMDVGRIIQSATVTKLAPEIIAAYNAPFPDASYKAGAHKFPLLVPISPQDEAAPTIKRAKEAYKQWTKPALVMFSDKDPVTAGGDKGMRRLIPSAKNEPEITIRDAGHFLQEDKGEEIAGHILEFIARRSV
ncbi:haloalkane dehalogenase [Candidatus Sumerlaeota bacterium]|nr:haloalkane dehalogenase [Candidatus Sumerlaeota bacterium]